MCYLNYVLFVQIFLNSLLNVIGNKRSFKKAIKAVKEHMGYKYEAIIEFLGGGVNLIPSSSSLLSRAFSRARCRIKCVSQIEHLKGFSPV